MNTGKLEVLTCEDGVNKWGDSFYMQVLPDKPEEISLASHVRKITTVFLFDEFDERRYSNGAIHKGREESQGIL